MLSVWTGTLLCNYSATVVDCRLVTLGSLRVKFPCLQRFLRGIRKWFGDGKYGLMYLCSHSQLYILNALSRPCIKKAGNEIMALTRDREGPKVHLVAEIDCL